MHENVALVDAAHSNGNNRFSQSIVLAGYSQLVIVRAWVIPRYNQVSGMLALVDHRIIGQIPTRELVDTVSHSLIQPFCLSGMSAPGFGRSRPCIPNESNDRFPNTIPKRSHVQNDKEKGMS